MQLLKIIAIMILAVSAVLVYTLTIAYMQMNYEEKDQCQQQMTQQTY